MLEHRTDRRKKIIAELLKFVPRQESENLKTEAVNRLTTAQAKALTRQVDALIRLAVNALDSVSDS